MVLYRTGITSPVIAVCSAGQYGSEQTDHGRGRQHPLRRGKGLKEVQVNGKRVGGIGTRADRYQISYDVPYFSICGK